VIAAEGPDFSYKAVADRFRECMPAPSFGVPCSLRASQPRPSPHRRGASQHPPCSRAVQVLCATSAHRGPARRHASDPLPACSASPSHRNTCGKPLSGVPTAEQQPRSPSQHPRQPGHPQSLCPGTLTSMPCPSFHTAYNYAELLCPPPLRVLGRSTAWHGTARPSTAPHGTARHGTERHGAARHGTAQHSTAQHSSAQHSTAQHSTA
jgi:hypothetical protein